MGFDSLVSNSCILPPFSLYGEKVNPLENKKGIMCQGEESACESGPGSGQDGTWGWTQCSDCQTSLQWCGQVQGQPGKSGLQGSVGVQIGGVRGQAWAQMQLLKRKPWLKQVSYVKDVLQFMMRLIQSSRGKESLLVLCTKAKESWGVGKGKESKTDFHGSIC